MKCLIYLVAASAILTAVIGRSSADEQPGAQPKFKITTKRETDEVKVEVENQQTVFSIRSPFGISEAVIQRTADKWPDNVTLRLHLQGLEQFRASNGKVTLHAAVSSHNDQERVRQWKDSQEDAPLDSRRNPFWMKVRMVSRDGKPATEIPLQGGCFEISLPRPFFEQNSQSITVSWIDFYRN